MFGTLIRMSLTSPLLLGVIAALAAIVPIVLIVLWGRRPRGISGRLLRLAGIVLCQVLAVGAIGRSEFSAAVSFGGYVDSETDPTTGSLFKGNATLRNENSPIWLIRQPPQRQTNLLIVASKQDKDAWVPGAKYADTSQMVTQSSGTPGVATLLMATGGHNYNTSGPTLPPSLAWLARVGAV